MRKFISTLLALTILVAIVASCKAESKDTKDNLPDYEDDQIVFILERVNYAWGYNYSICPITADGTAYPIDLSDSGRKDWKVEDAFNLDLEDGVQKYNDEKMEELLTLLNSIEDFELESSSRMCDYGMNTVYGVIYNEDGTYEIVKLGAYGDWYRIPTDEAAYELCNKLGLYWE